MSGQTIGGLVADDLGLVVTIRDGGTRYTGTLREVHHRLHANGRDAMTWWVLRDDSWSAMKSLPSSTPVEIHPAPFICKETP